MTPCDRDLALDVYQQHSLWVNFSDLDLSLDVEILLASQAESHVQICQDDMFNGVQIVSILWYW